MKEEALKLADELDEYVKHGDVNLSNSYADMIRKLVAELDKCRGKNFDSIIIDELNKKDKPVAWMTDEGKIVSNREKEKYEITFGDYCTPLYTSPLTKPLTDDEIINLYAEINGNGILAFARAIEERYGIK